MTDINLDDLTHLQAINKKLTSGYHISEQDTLMWQELEIGLVDSRNTLALEAKKIRSPAM